MPTTEFLQQELAKRQEMLLHASPQAAGVLAEQIKVLQGEESTASLETDLSENPGCLGGLLRLLGGGR